VSAAHRFAPGLLLLAAGVFVLGLADALVIHATTGFFGQGFNSPMVRGAADVASFATAGAILDVFLLATGFAVVSTLTRPISLATGPAGIALASALTLCFPLAFDVISHRLHRIFGQVLGIDILIHLAGGRVSDAALEAISEAPAAVLLVSATLVALVVGVRVVRRFEPTLEGRVQLVGPSMHRLLALAAVAGAIGAVILGLAAERWPSVAFGLERKPSAQLLLLLVRTATDADRDGYGLLSRPRDPAAWDPGRHPYALELPANGIDEDGVGGDLPADFRAPGATPVPQEVGAKRPSFLLVLLESFRGDLVGLRFAAQEVTPVLNRLAREGASSTRAFAHNPLTWPSRAQLFQGRLKPSPGAPTLIDDFKALGYRVAYFSGQDDSHGGSEELVGYERADVFFDARSDRERRTSRSGFAVSLQIPWSVVLDRVRTYLDATRDDARPLFLYVNLVDNHYPYHHAELEKLLGVEPVRRSEIRPENAQRVFETYLQASANVDRAVGELVGLWRERMGSAPIAVTGDHGQSFYESGMLGHGQTVDEAQTRVPLILVGIGGSWPEPLGLADLRGLLLSNLFEEPGRARFVVASQRRIFQYTGPLERPRRIGLRSSADVVGWEFANGRAERSGDALGKSIPPDDAQLRDVIWSWETLVNEVSPAATPGLPAADP
jgi:hypothetical protein